MSKIKLKLFTILIGISTLMLGIAYASTSDINLVTLGTSTSLGKETIKITNVEYHDDNSADTIDSKILQTSKTLMQNKVVLGSDKDSFITYQVTVKNYSENDLYYIETTQNNDFYYNSNNQFNDIIIYEISGIDKYEKVEPNATKSFLIKFKYNVDNNESITEENTVLNSYLNFKFKRLFKINYENITNYNYPDNAIEGEESTITFTNSIPIDVNVDGNCNSTYQNGVLTLKNVKSDITIKNDNQTTMIFNSALTNDLRIGSVINYNTYQSNLESEVSSTYFKYKIDQENTVNQINICKKYSDNAASICLIGVDSLKYEDNKNVMLEYFDGDINNIPDECNEVVENSEKELTCSNEYVLLKTNTIGNILINDLENTKKCEINTNLNIYTCS